jgi:hypothetical protein
MGLRGSTCAGAHSKRISSSRGGHAAGSSRHQLAHASYSDSRRRFTRHLRCWLVTAVNVVKQQRVIDDTSSSLARVLL